MSIFITNLAYTTGEFISASKVGILAGSFAAGLLGYLVLLFRTRSKLK
jgi:NhaA family Na+:H+ antiporter